MKLKPNDRLKADISSISYLLEKYRPNKYQGYQYDKINSTKKIAIYYKDKKAIIGFRGTKVTSLRDLHSDAFIMLNKMGENKYFREAESNFINIVSSYPNHKLDLTGHSLGGAITLYLTSIPDLKEVIYNNTVFNPGITQAPIKKHIIEAYAKNKKNRFIVKKGDPISNGIIKYNPKNMVLIEDPVYKNPLQNHSLNLFTSDKFKKYSEKLLKNEKNEKTKKIKKINKNMDFDIWSRIKKSRFT